MTASTDRLNSRLAADTDTAFPDVVRSFQDGVYSGALQFTKNHHDAEDVTQETFVRAYRALTSYDEQRIRSLRLRAWVWTIALNLCRNRARSVKRHPETVLVEDRSDTIRDPVTEAAESADLVVWRSRLAELSGPQQAAVVLRHVVDLSYEEIAEATGRPEATVRSDVRRGLTRLRSIVEKEI